MQEDANIYGIDWNGPISLIDDDDTVIVPETTCILTDEDFEELKITVLPASFSESFGVDLYMSTFSFVQDKLNNYLQ